jgi:hypothetical protein
MAECIMCVRAMAGRPELLVSVLVVVALQQLD